MAPAFHTNRGSVSFIFLIVTLLVLPVILSYFNFPDRRNLYDELAPVVGLKSHASETIFEGKRNCDVLYLGSSAMCASIRPGETEKFFKKKLGRDPVIDYLVLEYTSSDKLYIALQDYLKFHSPKLVVLTLPWRTYFTNGPSHNVNTLIRYGEMPETFDDVNFWDKAKIYCEFVLSGPRQILNLIRPNQPFADRFYDDVKRRSRQAMWGKFTKETIAPNPGLSSRCIVNVDSPKIDTSVTRDKPTDYIPLFYKKIFEVLSAKKISLLLINFPELTDSNYDRIFINLPLAQIFPPSQKVLCVSMKDLFSGAPKSEIIKFFRDAVHMNENGNNVFEPVAIPAIYAQYLEAIGDTRG